jgi:hypothetical protein
MTAPESTADLLTDVLDYIRRYMVLGDEQIGTLALWVLHTHAIDAATATPYLRVTSAIPGCGKSRLFEVLREVVARGLKTSGLSAAALPRAIESLHPTLLLDELDNQMKGDREMAATLTGILNDGYRRGGCTYKLVPASGKGKDKGWELVEFNVFGAKAFAGIKDLDDALSTRCIPIRISPRREGEEIEDFYVGDAREKHAELIGRLEVWGAGAVEQLSQIEPRRLAKVTDRTAEVWAPLLQIAELAGSDWLGNAQLYARALYSGEANMSEAAAGILALVKLRELFGDDHSPASSLQLITALNDDAELPFAEWGKDGITAYKLGHLLRPFGVHSKNIRGAYGKQSKGYTWQTCLTAFQTYLT